ncbi:hypothetical protein MLD38_020614 [Melastoma candidum]|uniref:Uncharacterized protein n=1 Tax=Melastoma candidum TaxID=119954 RepID=A0ACB9QGH4_9MYRT|nr:hypothetical protein MLD38_020614 [Melastoma candidum]
MAPPASVTKLLELNLMSAQDLAPVSKSMRTYAVAWVHPDRKLTTRVDENGQANPSWNEKFVFRVDDDSLKNDSCTITIEVYALTWLRVILIGTVNAPLQMLIPPSSSKTRIPTGGATMRFVTLQIMRPSGRPQGTINVGVSVINNPIHSMPLHSELSASTMAYDDNHISGGVSKHKMAPAKAEKVNLWRSRSERTNDRYLYNPGSTVCDDSVIRGGSMLGSMVSDVGPSASIVAAAIAKGIYPRKVAMDDTESSLLDNWADHNSVEGLKTKIERWRKELPPVPPRENRELMQRPGQERGKQRRNSDGAGLFSCFGAALGCEFSISCGGGGARRGGRDAKKHRRYNST